MLSDSLPALNFAQHPVCDEIGVAIQHVDEALYRAKQSGRDSVCAYMSGEKTVMPKAA